MSLTENSNQHFLPGGCNITQNLRFDPYTIIIRSDFKTISFEKLTFCEIVASKPDFVVDSVMHARYTQTRIADTLVC